MILAGDIGGTKVRVALFERSNGVLKITHDKTFPSHDYPSLDAIVALYTRDLNLPVERACFGVAGPIKNNAARITNLPWIIEAKTLSSELKGVPISLLNDVEANAYGIAELKPEEQVTLQEGDSKAVGNAALLSPGTGLGIAGLYWDGERHRPFACEGGHADFAPSTPLDAELLAFLHKRFGHVSWERVLSGQGQVNIYQFMREKSGEPEPQWLTEEFRTGEPGATITRAADSGKCKICAQTVELLVHHYGAQAGNLALTYMTWGGVYIGGGIAPKILDHLRKPQLLQAFLDKGRMSELLAAMPVRVILNPDTALLGAAHYASLL
jgi:glucokinase